MGQAEPLPHLGSLSERLRGPARLAVAPDDSVLVSDPLSLHIVRYNASGALSDVWPVPEGPIGVGAHPDGRFFVSLRDESKVALYDSGFNFLEYLGEDEPLVSFTGPTDIAIARDTGRIYVVDAEGDRIFGFESDGTLALILGARGSSPGQVVYPSAIAVDEPRNRLIVADHDKNRIHVFTTAGVFLQQLGARLTSSTSGLEGWVVRPLGLTVDGDGNIYVTDALMGTVRVLGPTGADLGKVVDYGYEVGELRVPCDLALSNDGTRLYVVNAMQSRVEVYGTTTGERGSLVDASGSTTNGKQPPAGVPLDPWGLSRDSYPYLNGPHRVEDRPHLCEPCHRINGQPGGLGGGGTPEGQPVLCMSCHNAAGRALKVPLHHRDLADPFGTNDVAVDGRGRSHAWRVPAINAQAGSDGPLAGSDIWWKLDDDGNIMCATCHNQHNIDHGPSYLLVSNAGDAICKECHAPRDRGPGEGRSHPVGFVYPEGEGEYPPSGELAPFVVKDSMVECMTCHAPHAADSGGANEGDGDGMLLRGVNDETLCRKCHTEHTIHAVSGEWQPTCRECHDIHDADNENFALIAAEVDGTPVTFLEESTACDGSPDYIHGNCDPADYEGICEVCHVSTDYHRNSPDADHAHQADVPCTECHLHSIGFLASCTDCHGTPPDGAESPNRASSHAIHFTAVSGPRITDCKVCHVSQDSTLHDNGAVSFASGVDADLDGNISLAEADVCDTCHGDGGPLDGVNDPVIGAKGNWADGVYDGESLRADKADWCLGCHDHDTEGAFINDVRAPALAGDNRTWGYNVAGHGQKGVFCTDCHDRTLPHTDGLEKTFETKAFPLTPNGAPKPSADREQDREWYNDGYRLRRFNNGVRALAVPRDAGAYNADDFKLCFSCHVDEFLWHDEAKVLGVPGNYAVLFSEPPLYLELPVGVAQTNFRNEQEWGFAWDWHGGFPSNTHWKHMGINTMDWNIDHDAYMADSRRQCVTCHNPHGVLGYDGVPTPAMCMADLAISFGVDTQDGTDYDYGYIGSGAFMQRGGDLHCMSTCHTFGQGTRYYREVLPLHQDDCLVCHPDDGRNDGTSPLLSRPTVPDGGSPARGASVCFAAGPRATRPDCLVCHSMRAHRQGRVLLNDPRAEDANGVGSGKRKGGR
jgi:DNA-binding beta-propeller fold protein YncE